MVQGANVIDLGGTANRPQRTAKTTFIKTTSPAKGVSPHSETYTKITTITKTTQIMSPKLQKEEEEKIIERYEHKLSNSDDLSSPLDANFLDTLNDRGSHKMTMHLKWRKGLGAKGSAWQSRASVLISQDLLILGGSDANDSQLYICDTNTLQWSGAALNGRGPQSSPFYFSLPSEQGDKLILFYPVREKGLLARVTHSYEAGDRTKVGHDLEQTNCILSLLSNKDSKL
jgi:hypothetical protein